MAGHFEVAVLVGPHLKTECQMVHVLPGHAVHVPEMNVVRRVQLVEAAPFAVAFITGRRIELGAQAGLPWEPEGSHRHRYGRHRLRYPWCSGPAGSRTRAYFPELVVAFQRHVHSGATRSELLDGTAAEGMPGLVLQDEGR